MDKESNPHNLPVLILRGRFLGHKGSGDCLTSIIFFVHILSIVRLSSYCHSSEDISFHCALNSNEASTSIVHSLLFPSFSSSNLPPPSISVIKTSTLHFLQRIFPLLAVHFTIKIIHEYRKFGLCSISSLFRSLLRLFSYQAFPRTTKKMFSENKMASGPGYVTLNVIRALNIISLLLVVVASWIMLVMTVKTSNVRRVSLSLFGPC